MKSETAANRYRREAEECRRNAEKAMRPVDREAWLRLAADWAKLAADAKLNNSLLDKLRKWCGLKRAPAHPLLLAWV
jgi:hypothetical protein